MRSFAMSLAATGATIIVGVFVYFVLAFILPAMAEDPGSEAAPFLPILAGFIAVFTALGLASWLWPSARRRAWFWLFHVIAGALVLLMFGPQITFSLTHPADAQGFIPTVLALLGAGLAIVGGIAAFLDVRRGAPAWTRSGRAGLVVTALGGLILGAVVTSALAGTAGSSGGGVAEAPTRTGVVTAEKSAWIEASLEMDSGEVLGLFVINKDDYAHSFDIDELGISVQLPANATTSVSIKPTAAAALEFYCAVPGHREAGMVGTLTIR